jgi:hypothetical protein
MRPALLLLGFLLTAVPVPAQNDSLPVETAPRFQAQGYLKDLQLAAFSSRKGSLSTGNLLHNRLNFKYALSPTLSARLELRTRIFWGEQVRQTRGFDRLAGIENGLMDLSWTPIREPALVGHVIADRLSVAWQHGRWDVTLGRQRINWGITTAWNPNDLFNASNFFDFDYEERPGADALRVRFSPGNRMAGFDLALGKDSAATTVALLYRFNRRGYDFQVLGAWYQHDLALGAGWAGSIGQAGFKGEATWFQPRRHLADTAGTLALTVESNYTFAGGWYVAGAFLYTGGGRQEDGGLDRLTTQTLSPKMLMPYEYSILTQVAKQFTPLFTTTLSVIYGPGPHALIVFPVLTYSLSDNWDLNLVGQSLFDAGEEKFRNRGNLIMMRLKWGF